ncbi:MAG: hypothetical protein ACFFCO_01145, partial [Promethearchaeota archaeon]
MRKPHMLRIPPKQRPKHIQNKPRPTRPHLTHRPHQPPKRLWRQRRLHQLQHQRPHLLKNRRTPRRKPNTMRPHMPIIIPKRPHHLRLQLQRQLKKSRREPPLNMIKTSIRIPMLQHISNPLGKCN